MTRAERYKIRYRALINQGLPVKEARALRSRSDKHIYETIGIKIPKKLPKLKNYTKETIYKKQLQIRKYQYARERGIKPELALKLRKRSYKDIETSARYYTPPTPKKIIKTRKDMRDSNISTWGDYASRKDFPKHLEDQAKRINLKNGFDANASYGWTIVFYAFIEGDSVAKWEQLIEADAVTESAIYKTTMRIS